MKKEKIHNIIKPLFYFNKKISVLQVIFTVFLFAMQFFVLGILFFNLKFSSSTVVFSSLIFTVLTLLSLKIKFCNIFLSVIYLICIIYFYSLTPQKAFKDTLWQTPWQKVPRITLIDKDTVKIDNIRDFIYKSENDYIVNYKSGIFKFNEVASCDLVVSHWNDIEPIAHTMIIINFYNLPSLVFSVETRLPENSTQGFLPGLFRQYERIMLIGTVDDLIKLRTDFRGEDVFKYRINCSKEKARSLFKNLLEEAYSLSKNPSYYNTLFFNCTTTLKKALDVLTNQDTSSWRLLLNGYTDRHFYNMNYLKKNRNESFNSLKSRSLLPGKCNGIVE